MKKSEKVFTEKVIKVLKEDAINNAMKSQLRIVQYLSNGNPGAVKVEKRIIFSTGKLGKVQGLNRSDWEFLLKIEENISELLK